MKTITINIYKFDELDKKAKHKAIEDHRQSMYGEAWDEWPKDDAKEVGLKITDYDIDRGDFCSLDMIDDHDDVANKIIETHGKQADTFRAAEKYWNEYSELNSGKQIHTKDSFTTAHQHIKDDFFNALCRAYLWILRNECQSYFSDETVIGNIQANEYEYFKNGRFYIEGETQ